jgi:hypothetical protein
MILLLLLLPLSATYDIQSKQFVFETILLQKYIALIREIIWECMEYTNIRFSHYASLRFDSLWKMRACFTIKHKTRYFSLRAEWKYHNFLCRCTKETKARRPPSMPRFSTWRGTKSPRAKRPRYHQNEANQNIAILKVLCSWPVQSIFIKVMN